VPRIRIGRAVVIAVSELPPISVSRTRLSACAQGQKRVIEVFREGIGGKKVEALASTVFGRNLTAVIIAYRGVGLEAAGSELIERTSGLDVGAWCEQGRNLISLWI
jgi:hypothetical protein